MLMGWFFYLVFFETCKHFSLFKFKTSCCIPLGLHLEMSGSLIIFLTAEEKIFHFIFTLDESTKRSLIAKNQGSQFIRFSSLGSSLRPSPPWKYTGSQIAPNLSVNSHKFGTVRCLDSISSEISSPSFAITYMYCQRNYRHPSNHMVHEKHWPHSSSTHMFTSRNNFQVKTAVKSVLSLRYQKKAICKYFLE